MSRLRNFGVSNERLSCWDEREARWAQLQLERRKLAPIIIAAQAKPNPPQPKSKKAERKAAKRARRAARMQKRRQRLAAVASHRLLNGEWESAMARDGS